VIGIPQVVALEISGLGARPLWVNNRLGRLPDLMSADESNPDRRVQRRPS